VLNLYEHDNSHDFYSSASSNFLTEGVDSPCRIAGLEENDENCYDIFGEDDEKVKKLFEKFSDDEFGGFHECPWLSRCFDKSEENSPLLLWEDFAKNVKHKARYFDHKDFSVTKTLEKFNEFFEKTIYRARLIDSDKTENDIKNNPKSEELGKTPKKYAQNNRFSSVGISYGYFAFDKKTALAETRASKGDKFVIGEFSLSLNLKLVDFRQNSISKLTNPFLDTFDIRSYCASFTIKKFIEDISKPISDKDSLLEYVPTQVMAEYIWHKGYDGFIFDSSQKSGGENIVIFGENPAYKSYSIVEIKEVNLEFDEV
jgi:hypothetical protein